MPKKTPRDRAGYEVGPDGYPLDPLHPWNQPSGWEQRIDPYERDLLHLERYFRGGVTLAAVEAMLTCQRHSMPWPEWLRAAATDLSLLLFFGDLPKEHGRTGNARSAYLMEVTHWTRWDMVEEIRNHVQPRVKKHREMLRRHTGDPEALRQLYEYPPPEVGTTWPEAYAAASRELRGTFAQGSPGAMKASYELVQKQGVRPRFLYLERVVRRARAACKPG